MPSPTAKDKPSRHLRPIAVMTWELDALAAMLERVEPMTPAEEWMRNRIIDAHVRSLNG